MAQSRSINRGLVRLLTDCSSPVYALDDQRTIVYCNRACAEWVGMDAAELTGTRCDYHSDFSAGSELGVAATLCPPPEVFDGQRLDGQVACRHESGSVSRRRAVFLPLAAADTGAGVIVIVETEECDDNDAAAEHSPSEAADLHQRLIQFRREFAAQHNLDRLIGDSSAMVRVRQQVRVAMAARSHAVIVGPPGSQRERLAKTIHYGEDSENAARLVPLDCSLVDAELLQATIRSVKRGPDVWTSAGPGTLLLLNVDELPPDAQHELAGFLEFPDFELHTIATSRRDLIELAEQGSFRRDAAFSLSTLVIQIPPLADRRQDIPLLAQLLLEETNASGGRQLSGFTEDALNHLALYDWPGNVEELTEVVRDACGHATGATVTAADLSERIRFAAQAAAHPAREEETIVLDDFLAEIEAELIARALKQAKGNKTKAAELLGVTRARLHRRLEQMDLE